jgi:cell division protein FtsB
VGYPVTVKSISGTQAILALLVLLFLILQYVLWLGDFSHLRLMQLESAVLSQQEANNKLEQRNQRLRAEVIDLKQGTAALEERARMQLGMIKKGEVFFQVIESE